jgi:hypothetical protein
MPAAMLDAPNKKKQPRIVVTPCRRFTRPLSIRTPTQATATTATVVAMVPISVCWSHETAATSGLEPIGSVREPDTEIRKMCVMRASTHL